MNKLYSIVFFLVTGANVIAQTIPNGTFEQWNDINYSNPTGWESSNRESIRQVNAPNVFKTTDSQSGLALKLQTLVQNGDTAGAYASNTEGDPTSGEGGVPYAAIPTALTGYYKYNLPGNDTALILVIFKKNGSIVSQDLFKIRGTTGVQSTYTQFTFPLSLSVMPDSVILAAASSNLISQVGVEGGSTLFLDELAFNGAAAMPAIPNGSFENWSNLSFSTPVDWQYMGEMVGKTTDAYLGTYAIALGTKDYGNGNFSSSGIRNGIGSNFGTGGGRPYNKTSDVLSGFYKFTTANILDSAQITMMFKNNGNFIGFIGKKLGQAAVYTPFTIPITLFSAPDTMVLEIFSTSFSNQAENTLYIDQVQLNSDPAGVINTLPMQVSVYPNPFEDELNIVSDVEGDFSFCIYDLQNRLIANSKIQAMPGVAIQISVDELASGMYTYVFRNEKINVAGKVVKQ